MTLRPFRAAAREYAAALVFAAVVVLTVGTTAAAQHVHDEDHGHEEDCSLCVACGVEDACVAPPALLPQFAANTAPIGSLDQRNQRTPFHTYRARAPPLSR